MWYSRGVEAVLERMVAPLGKNAWAIDPHVRGHFDEPTDRFDSRKGHSVSFTMKPGRNLKHLRGKSRAQTGVYPTNSLHRFFTVTVEMP